MTQVFDDANRLNGYSHEVNLPIRVTTDEGRLQCRSNRLQNRKSSVYRVQGTSKSGGIQT